MSIKKRVIPSRLGSLREARGLTQQQFADQINELLPADLKLTIPLISSWETGRRTCSPKYVDIIAKYYDVTVEYLYGETKEDAEKYQEIKSITEKLKELTQEQLVSYDGQPIYVVFREQTHLNQWGIFNAKRSNIVFVDSILPISVKNIGKLRLYSMIPFEEIPYSEFCKRRMNITTFYRSTHIYVSMKTTDPVVKAKYDGWYRHNEDNSMLINQTGLTLPYEGLGISYFAYHDMV